MLTDGIISLLSGQLGSSNQTAFTGLITALTNLTGTRVYKNQLPRGYALPSICVHGYGDSEDYDLLGPIGVQERQIKIDIYEDPAAEDTGDVYEAVRALLINYTGTLPDGTKVSLTKLERGMDMPFLPRADQKGIASRALLGFTVITT